MRVVKAAAVAVALLGTGAVAMAQTPPADPQTKADKESPTTMGAGKGAQPAELDGRSEARDRSRI